MNFSDFNVNNKIKDCVKIIQKKIPDLIANVSGSPTRRFKVIMMKDNDYEIVISPSLESNNNVHCELLFKAQKLFESDDFSADTAANQVVQKLLGAISK